MKTRFQMVNIAPPSDLTAGLTIYAEKRTYRISRLVLSGSSNGATSFILALNVFNAANQLVGYFVGDIQVNTNLPWIHSFEPITQVAGGTLGTTVNAALIVTKAFLPNDVLIEEGMWMRVDFPNATAPGSGAAVCDNIQLVRFIDPT